MSTVSSQKLLYLRLPGPLPASHVAVPIFPEADAGFGRPALRICAVLRAGGGGGPGAGGGSTVASAGSGAGGTFEPIRDTLDARVVLGCLCDAAGRVHKWLELWVQTADAAGLRLPSAQEAVSNRQLDDRWAKRADVLDRLTPEGVLRTGFEERHPAPVFLDVPGRQAFVPAVPRNLGSGQWSLCQDEARLAKAGLPPYATSLHRYLAGGPAPDCTLVPVTADAPTSASTKPMDEALGLPPEAAPFNPGGGLLMVVPHYPVGFEQYVDALGEAADGAGLPALLGSASAAIGGDAHRAAYDGSLAFVTRRARLSRLPEVLFLRLRLLHDAVASVRALTASSQEPLLNVSARSFRVALGQGAGGVPFLWGARAVLCDPGVGVALPIASTQQRLFVALGSSGQPIYGATSSAQGLSGVGELRLTKLLPDGVIEATLKIEDKIAGGARDFVWVRFGLGAGRVDLFGMVDRTKKKAPSEVAFRSVPTRLDKAVEEELRTNLGVVIHDVNYQLAQLLSSPGDLFSLAMLSIRALLVNADQPLPVAFDEIGTLAQHLAADYDPSRPLGEQVASVLATDGDRLAALGPHRLCMGPCDAAEAARAVPMTLWSSVLAMIVRMLPGAGPASTCKDLGDAPPAALERVFDPALADLGSLLDRSRALIVADPASDAEIAGMLRKLARTN